MKPNIFFLLIDSLRQDKCYGKTKTAKTPNLDELIKNGTIFEQAISPASITVPSTSSIFTGLHPYECTSLDNDIFNLISNSRTFIHDLKDLGYHISAIIPESLIHTNLAKIFSDVETFNSFATLYDDVGEKIQTKIKNGLKNHPWFLYIHLEDLHGNAVFHLNNEPQEINDQQLGKNQYDRMLSVMDAWLGNILNDIDKKNTFIIITSDHGSTSADYTDEMLEFNKKNDNLRQVNPGIDYKFAHKLFSILPNEFTPIRKKLANMYIDKRNKKVKKRLEPQLEIIPTLKLTPYQERILKKSVVYPRDCYDENFRPALIFSGHKTPKGKIVKTQISSIDIFPTILELIGSKSKNKHHGRSLVPLFNDMKFEEHPVLLDAASTTTESMYSDTVGIRTHKFKYFRDRKNPNKNLHLFNLERDPYEQNNIHEQHPDIVKNLEEELCKIKSDGDFSFKNTDQLSEDEVQKAKSILKKLGYI